MLHSSIQMKSAATVLLLRSVFNLFPQSKIHSAGPGKKGFYCVCTFPHPFDDQSLRMVEEEMRRAVQENLSIETVEMMRENAAVFFRHQGQDFFAEQVEKNPSNIVGLVRIDHFCGPCPDPHLTGTKELGLIKLFASQEGALIKIEGISRASSKELKQYIKNLATFRSHEELGKQLDLFAIDDTGSFWAPRGERIRETLIQWWKIELRRLGFAIFSHLGGSPPCPPRFEYGRQLAQIFVKEKQERASMEGGLFDLPSCTSDSLWWDTDVESVLAHVNSYLHFIKKTVSMIAIDYSWIFYSHLTENQCSQNNRDLSLEILSQSLKLNGIEAHSRDLSPRENPAIEVRFKDSLGREWQGPKLELQATTSATFMMKGSVFESLEGLIAILLESTQGNLPFWISPEQVRILAVKESDAVYAMEIAQDLLGRGFRVYCDTGPGTLSERVYVANQYRVPCVVVIGKKERENREVSVKYRSEGEETRVLSYERFIEELQKQNEQAQFPY